MTTTPTPMTWALTLIAALAFTACASDAGTETPVGGDDIVTPSGDADAGPGESGDTTEPTPEDTTEPTPEDTTEPTPEDTTEPTPEDTTEPTPEDTTEPTPEDTTEPAPEDTTEPTPEDTTEPPADDQDGDGVLDGEDNCPNDANTDQADVDEDGIGDVCDDDIDGDNVSNDADNCPTQDNVDQSDMDFDTVGDACDDDMDGDAFANDDDNCPEIVNADQHDSDGDGHGDACDDCHDPDSDGTCEPGDNCPAVNNPEQSNIDGDDLGDLCDDDMDGDGVANDVDNCSTVANDTQDNSDGDEHGDACDNCAAVDNSGQADTDGDGMGNACDDDMDGDGTDNDADDDTDGDGLSDAEEVTLGTDPNLADTDGDTYSDAHEVMEGKDPLDPENRIYIGYWPYNPDKGAIADPGWDAEPNLGTIMPNYQALDQHGDLVNLYDFAADGKPVVLDVVTWFCSPCKAMAEYFSTGDASLMDDFLFFADKYDIVRDLIVNDDIHWITIIWSGGLPVEQADAALWEETWPSEHITVLADTDLTLQSYLYVKAMPRIDVLDEAMTFVSFCDGDVPCDSEIDGGGPGGPSAGLKWLLSYYESLYGTE